MTNKKLKLYNIIRSFKLKMEVRMDQKITVPFPMLALESISDQAGCEIDTRYNENAQRLQEEVLKAGTLTHCETKTNGWGDTDTGTDDD